MLSRLIIFLKTFQVRAEDEEERHGAVAHGFGNKRINTCFPYNILKENIIKKFFRRET